MGHTGWTWLPGPLLCGGWLSVLQEVKGGWAESHLQHTSSPNIQVPDFLFQIFFLSSPHLVHWLFLDQLSLPSIFHFSVQFSSVAQSCLTFCDPKNRGTPGLPVHHQLPEFIQTHAHRVSYAIQPYLPLLSPSPPTPNPSQHQGLFQWVSSSHEVAKVLEFQLQHQSFQWTPRTDLL